MKSLATLLRSLTAVTFGVGLAAAAQAGPYSALVVFGDSLSDAGNDLLITGGAVPATGYYTDGTHTGRFTNGLSYADRLASALGLGLTPSLLGGTDYAYGGARTTYVNPGLQQFGALSFNQQLSNYTGSHAAADPNALYVLWIGANDMSDAITAAAGGNPSAIGSAIGTALGGIGGAIQTLASRGAQHFLVPNLPDLSLVPQVRGVNSAGLSGLAHVASLSFNEKLDSTLSLGAFAGIDIRRLDVLAAQTQITLAPAAFGFSNVTSACYTGEVTGQPLPGGPAPTVCANPASYLYWDYEHPTDALHAVLAQRALVAVVPEPPSVALLAAGCGLLLWLRRRTPTPAVSG